MLDIGLEACDTKSVQEKYSDAIMGAYPARIVPCWTTCCVVVCGYLWISKENLKKRNWLQVFDSV